MPNKKYSSSPKKYLSMSETKNLLDIYTVLTISKFKYIKTTNPEK